MGKWLCGKKVFGGVSELLKNLVNLSEDDKSENVPDKPVWQAG
jgi:hypothetical protein